MSARNILAAVTCGGGGHLLVKCAGLMFVWDVRDSPDLGTSYFQFLLPFSFILMSQVLED